jgi:hypothetical protein
VFTHIAQAHVLDELRVNVGALDDFLEQLDDDAVQRCVFEASFLALCQWRADGECDDDVVSVFGLSVMYISVLVRGEHVREVSRTFEPDHRGGRAGPGRPET